jgi:hypothetical protein
LENAHPSDFRAQKSARSQHSAQRPQGKFILTQSANVFLNKNEVAKLGDMNVSKIAKNGLLYTQTGTPYYASP